MSPTFFLVLLCIGICSSREYIACDKIQNKNTNRYSLWQGNQRKPDGLDRERRVAISESREGTVDSVETKLVVVGVISDSGTKVQLMLKAFGLKKKKSVLNSIATHFKKHDIGSASKLFANGQFTNFRLSSSSLAFTLEVQRDEKKKGNGNRVDTFVLDIKKFPSSVNAESAKLEVVQPASGECFILLSLIKTDNLNVNWKEFLASHGTIDASTI